MKAEELQIGDIIQSVVETIDDDDNEVVYKVPARVNAIDANGMMGINGDCSILVNYLVENEMDCYEKFDYFEPIQLTEEMLINNGFEDLGKYLRLQDDLLMIHRNGGKLWVIVGTWAIDIQYVHKLQHLLRFCGLNDLANNFKIE